jgi:hemoglobin/transferrin/lactoferrin receptor protein
MRIPLVPSLLMVAVVGWAAESVPEVVSVSATRLEADPFVQPYTQYQYTAEDQRAANTGRALDALSLTPGVIVQRTAGNQASPYIRGLTGQQTLLMFDGVRLSHAGFRPGPNQYAAMIPDEALGRTDVILGSGTSVLGSDALTGAMDFRLAEAGRGVSASLSPWARMRAASAEGGQGQAGVDGRLGDFAYSLDGGYIEQHDIEGGQDAARRLQGVSGDDQTIPNSSYRQTSAGARVAYLGVERNRFEVAGGHVRQYDAPRADGYAANSGVATRWSRTYDPQVFDYLHLRHVAMGLGPVARLQTTLWWHRHHETQEREDITSTGAAARYRRRVNEDEIRTVGGDVQLTHRIANHEIVWGGTTWEDRAASGYERYRSPAGNSDPQAAVRDATGSTDPGQTTMPDGSRFRGVGVFAQDSWTFVPRWTLLAGVRWDHATWDLPITPDRPGYASYGNQGVSESASAVTGQGRLAWNPVDPLVVYTGVGQGFRAPTFSDLAGQQDRASSSSGGTGPQTEGNPDLDPERSLTYEIGTRWSHAEDTASLAAFRTELHDLIQVVYYDCLLYTSPSPRDH